jgi:hypothetical protein
VLARLGRQINTTPDPAMMSLDGDDGPVLHGLSISWGNYSIYRLSRPMRSCCRYALADDAPAVPEGLFRLRCAMPVEDAVQSLWKMRLTGRMSLQGSSKQRDCPSCLHTPVPAQVSDVPVRHGFAEQRTYELRTVRRWRTKLPIISGTRYIVCACVMAYSTRVGPAGSIGRDHIIKRVRTSPAPQPD